MKRKFVGLSAKALLLSLIAHTHSAQALDTDPGSYAQGEDGQTAMQATAQFRTSTNLQYSGSTIATSKPGAQKDSRAATELSNLHYTGFFEINGVMVDPHVFLPYSSVNHTEISGVNQNGSTGIGDPVLALVIAPVHTRDNSQVLGLGLAAVVPVGAYEPGKVFNPGDGRWKGIIQLDGIQKLSEQWSVVGSVDTTYYADNTKAGNGSQRLSQEASYQAQPWIRFSPIPELHISLGYSQTFGGKQFLNNSENGLETNARQVRLDFVTSPIDNAYWGLQFGRDIAVQGGYRESLRVGTRLTYVF